MHAAHARNSDQEFLELELYHDFSRCNPNSHEICMSQIARYTHTIELTADHLPPLFLASRIFDTGAITRERDRRAINVTTFHEIFTVSSSRLCSRQ